MSTVAEHWILRGYDEDSGKYGDVASSSDDGDDRIDMKLSFYRGPNYVKWMTKDCPPSVLRHMSEQYVFELVIYPENSHTSAMKLKLSLRNISWNPNRQRFEFLFFPYLHLYLDKQIEYAVNGNITVHQIIEDLFPDGAYSLDKITTHDKIYHDFCFKGTRSELLAYIAKDLEIEYYAGSYAVIMDKNVCYSKDAVYYPQIHTNSLSSFSKSIGGTSQKNAIIYSSGVSGPCVMPGYRVSIQGPEFRILYVHTTYKKSRGIETTIIGTDDYITEEEFADILPLEDKSYLLEKINSKSYSDIGFGKTNKDDGIKQELLTINTSHDTQNLSFLKKDKNNTPYVLTTCEKMTPFGGSIRDSKNIIQSSYGVQYPSIGNPISLLVFPESRRDMALSFGNIWQHDEHPKRNSEKDYRFTFPDGTTIYQEHSTGKYILSSKGEITIGFNNDSKSNEVPNSFTSQMVISDSSIIIERGSRKITINNSVVDVT